MTHRAPNKVFNFGGLTLKTAEELTFTKDDGKSQTVVQYFKAQYNITLRYPRLPCVVTGKKTYIPMELVKIEPFHSLPPLKLTPDQTAEMIKVSAKPPADRRDAIMAWRKKLAWETKPAVKAWGIEIKETFTEVPARVLNAPQIAYAGGPRGITKPAGGAWNLRGKKFFKAGKPLTVSISLGANGLHDTDRLYSILDATYRLGRSSLSTDTLTFPGCKVSSPSSSLR